MNTTRKIVALPIPMAVQQNRTPSEIFSFELFEDTKTVGMFQVQGGLWVAFEVNTDTPPKNYGFRLYHTGQNIIDCDQIQQMTVRKVMFKAPPGQILVPGQKPGQNIMAEEPIFLAAVPCIDAGEIKQKG